MADIADVADLSKSELRKLIRKADKRLQRERRKEDKASIRSSDERVVAIADQVRDLSKELGVKRGDIVAAVAGNMRVSLGSGKTGGKGDKSNGEAPPLQNAAPAPKTQPAAAKARKTKAATARGKAASKTSKGAKKTTARKTGQRKAKS